MTNRYHFISYGPCDDKDGYFAHVCDGPVNITVFADTLEEAFKELANELVSKLSVIRYTMDDIVVKGLKS